MEILMASETSRNEKLKSDPLRFDYSLDFLFLKRMGLRLGSSHVEMIGLFCQMMNASHSCRRDYPTNTGCFKENFTEYISSISCKTEVSEKN